MKKVSRTTKLLSWLVMLTFGFLCVFNITYSYFSTISKITGNGNMNDIDVSFIYISNSSSIPVSKSSTLQLFLESENISRGEVSALNVSASTHSGLAPVTDIGFRIGSNSCSVYLRFWVEAYKMKQINGTNYYIDSKNNYVDENGNYVNADGEAIEIAEENQGDVIDYGQYFELGYLNQGNYNILNSVYKNTTTYKENQYVTYFYKNLFTASNVTTYLFNSIKWLDTTPNDLLGSSMGVFVSFEAVQQQGNAYLSAFDDYRGYYNW